MTERTFRSASEQRVCWTSSPGFKIFEMMWEADRDIPAQPYEWATLCLTIDGGYSTNWHNSRLCCGPATLTFQPPGEIYGTRISSKGSHCLEIEIEPLVLESIDAGLSDPERPHVPRRPPPHWLAFELRREIELRDGASMLSVEATIVTLLAELADAPSVETRNTPLPWLERVREQLHDEFRQHHALADLALSAGVHHTHLAREFRRSFGCTIGHYIRQRRVEFACHRLAASPDSLSRIAFQSGFADQSHFTRVFRRLVGMSPGVFRGRFAASRRGRPAYRPGFQR